MPTVLGAPVFPIRLLHVPPTHPKGTAVLSLDPPSAAQPIWARPQWADFLCFPFAL